MFKRRTVKRKKRRQSPSVNAYLRVWESQFRESLSVYACVFLQNVADCGRNNAKNARLPKATEWAVARCSRALDKASFKFWIVKGLREERPPQYFGTKPLKINTLQQLTRFGNAANSTYRNSVVHEPRWPSSRGRWLERPRASGGIARQTAQSLHF